MSVPDRPASDPQDPVPLEYGRSSAAPTVRPKVVAVAAILALLIFFVVLFIATHFASRRAVERSNRILCRSNMRQIAQAMAMYAYNHGGQFPSDLETVLADEDLNPEVFVCPSSNDTPVPPGPTTQATAAGLRQPGHCSYIYLGKGISLQTVTPDTVLLYEALADHGGAGMHVLFGDYRVLWVPAPTAQKILTQHAASTQPIRLKIDASTP